MAFEDRAAGGVPRRQPLVRRDAGGGRGLARDRRADARGARHCGDSKPENQRAIVKKYVYEGFVDWARRNPTKGCPSNIQEVSEQMGRADSKDTWGRELIWFCGDNLPPGAARDGFAVMSLGPDGQQGTKDDIKSWE